MSANNFKLKDGKFIFSKRPYGVIRVYDETLDFVDVHPNELKALIDFLTHHYRKVISVE